MSETGCAGKEGAQISGHVIWRPKKSRREPTCVENVKSDDCPSFKHELCLDVKLYPSSTTIFQLVVPTFI